MHIKPHENWSTDPNIHAVRVEASPDRSILLPYEHLLYSELITRPEVQELHLYFLAHEVVVTGTCLRKIEAAVQRRDLAHLSVGIQLSGRMPEGMQPSIRKIEVKRVETGGGGIEDVG